MKKFGIICCYLIAIGLSAKAQSTCPINVVGKDAMAMGV